jgi:protein phosphatase
MAGETQILVPAVDVASRSDPGRDPTKQVNEDSCGWRETKVGVLAVVCDGMGGHVGGKEASTAALNAIFEAFDRAAPNATPREVLRDAIRLANVRVRGVVVSEPAGGRPGSTVVAVLVHAGGTEIAHVGDSRVYLVHQGQVFQLTRDHSMVQEMVDAKILTPAQAAVHPEANKITRALGIDDDVDVDVRPQAVPHVAGDAFVLCSDGLSDLVEAPEILQIVAGDPPQQAVGRLVDLANARGGHDNVTVMVVRPKSSAPPPGPVAPTVADSQVVTLRPPLGSLSFPSASSSSTPTVVSTPAITIISPPARVPDSPTRDEAHERAPKPSRALPAIIASVVALVAVVVVFARLQHEQRRSAAADAGAPAASDTAGSAGRTSVSVAPIDVPDAGEVDASEVTPLAPASSSAPRPRHTRHL